MRLDPSVLVFSLSLQPTLIYKSFYLLANLSSIKFFFIFMSSSPPFNPVQCMWEV